MHLDCPVDHVAEHPGGVELEQRHLDARLRPRSTLRASIVSRRQAWISAAESATQFCTVCLPASGPPNASRRARTAHQLERALHLPEPAHHVVDPPRAEPLLGEAEGIALARRGCSRRARARPCSAPRSGCSSRGPRAPSRARATISTPARRPGRGSSSRADAARPRDRRSRRRWRTGSVRAAREPLVPVDHPLVAVAYGARPQQRRIRPATSGSVIEKNERTSPATSGAGTRAF